MTPTPLSPEARVELVEKAKAALSGPTPIRYPLISIPPSTILSYEATVQALTVERDAERERVKALEAGPSREDVARIIEPHFDLSFDPDRGAVQNDIDRVANAALAKADAVLALLTPKDEPT